MKEFPSFFTHDTPLPAVGKRGVPAEPQQPDREEKQAYEPLPEYIPEQRALDTYRDMFTPHDIPLVKEVLRSMDDDPQLWRSRSQCEPITHTWPHLSFNARLFLLHTAIGIMTSPSAHDGKDDPELRAEEIINYCKEQESNFFLKNFALSFETESNRADASIERKRDILAGLWESSVRYGDEDDPVRVSKEVQKEAEKKAREITKGEYPWNNETYKAEIRKGLPPALPAGGKVTIFETSPVTYQWFDRYVEGPGDLTDEECAKLYDQLTYEDHFFRDFNPHHLDTSEWLNSERDTTFEKQHIPTSVYNRFIDERIWDNQEDFDANFAVCKVSSDVYALYGSEGGVREYFKSPQEREADSMLDVSQLLQGIHALMHDLGFDAPRMSREGTTYKQFIEANKALLEVIPHSLSERLKRYCERYSEQKRETHEYTSPRHEFLYEEYKGLTGELLAWCKETLGTHTIAATPFRELIHLSQGDTHALEHEFKHTLFASKRMREHMEKSFGFSYEDIDLATQLQFIRFVTSQPNEYIENVKAFTQQYGTQGIRTFLALERGDESLGEAIIAFGEHDKVAGTVFQYYGELLDSAGRAETLVREVSQCEGDVCTELAHQVRENILERAQKDLERAVRAHDPHTVGELIQRYIAEAKEYVALLQTIGADIETTDATYTKQEDREAMQMLQKENYERLYPGDTLKTFKEAVYASLRNSFDRKGTVFNILRHREKIVCFNRFDTIVDARRREVTYFGSFNADRVYDGAGGVMLEKTLEKRLEDGRPMMAHCDPTQPVTQKYIESGFIATKRIDFSGHSDFEIWRTRDIKNELKGKQRSHEELVACITSPDASLIVRETDHNETLPELNEGKALTRFFTQEGKTYAVFETLPSTLAEVCVFHEEEEKQAA